MEAACGLSRARKFHTIAHLSERTSGLEWSIRIMYAVIKTGGKQYRVAEGDTVLVEKLGLGEGDAVEFNDVLMLVDGDNVEVGSPSVAGATVAGKVIEQGRHDKIQIVKFQRRKQHLTRNGHRQLYTKVEITGIAKS